MKQEATSTCQACGARVPAGLDFCPVCALRGALDEARETSALDVDPTHSSPTSRFEHYQVLAREDGTLFELGRGAMGVTYKVFATSPEEVKDVMKRWGGRLLLEPLKQLKAGNPVLIHGDSFTVENGRAQFQFGNSRGDRREFPF